MNSANICGFLYKYSLLKAPRNKNTVGVDAEIGGKGANFFLNHYALAKISLFVSLLHFLCSVDSSCCNEQLCSSPANKGMKFLIISP